MTESAGALLRYWRTARGLSQMQLAHGAGISARHMSFVETGRARASREVLLQLAHVLEIPPREENALLETAGYARRHRTRALADPALDHVREVLAFLLERHEPNSAVVFDAGRRIVMANEAHRRSLALFTGGRTLPEQVRTNLLRLTFHPEGLRRHIVNFHEVGPTLLHRLERELREAPTNGELRALADEVASYGAVPPRTAPADAPPPLLLPIHLRCGSVEARFFSVLSMLGTAIDPTLQELRLESFFPADRDSATTLSALHGEASASAG